MNNHTISVRKQMDLIYLYNGITWLFSGIFGLFDTIIFEFLQILALLCCLILIVISFYFKKEMQDEMSIKNLAYAKATTLTNMHIVAGCIICFILILYNIPVITNISLDVKNLLIPLFFIFLGIENIMIGILFRRNERKDEECTY